MHNARTNIVLNSYCELVHQTNFDIAVIHKKVTEEIMAWHPDATYALGLHRAMGRIVGIWPLDSSSFTAKIRIVFVTIVPVSLSLFIIFFKCVYLNQFRIIRFRFGCV